MNLPLKILFYKLVTLLMLSSGQRVSTLHKFHTDEIQIRENNVTFYVLALPKHDRPTYTKKPFIYHAYPYNSQLCPVNLIKHYIHVRGSLVPTTEKAFFITHGKPYHPAAKDTLARWVKDVLFMSGIDTTIFQAHSCRSASTSAAKAAGVPIQKVLNAGQWSKESTFYKYYEKQIIWTDITDNQEFSHSMLNPKGHIKFCQCNDIQVNTILTGCLFIDHILLTPCLSCAKASLMRLLGNHET